MSAVLIAAQVLLRGGPAIVEQWLQPLLCALFPWTLHHTHTLRSGTLCTVSPQVKGRRGVFLYIEQHSEFCCG